MGDMSALHLYGFHDDRIYTFDFTSLLREIVLEQNVLGIYMYLQLCSFLASLKRIYATFRC